MRIRRVTPPAGNPVALDLVRMHCRIDDDYEDALVQQHLDAAVSWLDGYQGVLGRCIMTQGLRIDFDQMPGRFAIPMPDIGAVTAEYTDTDGGAVAFDRADCGGQTWITLRGPRGRPAAFSFTAGFGAAADVPPAIQQAILMLCGHFYDVRSVPERASGIPPEVDALISGFRMRRV